MRSTTTPIQPPQTLVPEEIAKRLEETTPEERRVLKRVEGPDVIGVSTPPDLDMLLESASATREEYYKLLKDVSIVLAKYEISSIKRDRMIIQAVEAQDDLEEALNILSERIREWYSLHFPELDLAVEDHREFVEFIKTYGKREGFPEEFGGISSMGARLGPEDIEILKRFASQIVHIYEFREELGSYIGSAMEETAPNLLARWRRPRQTFWRSQVLQSAPGCCPRPKGSITSQRCLRAGCRYSGRKRRCSSISSMGPPHQSTGSYSSIPR